MKSSSNVHSIDLSSNSQTQPRSDCATGRKFAGKNKKSVSACFKFFSLVTFTRGLTKMVIEDELQCKYFSLPKCIILTKIFARLNIDHYKHKCIRTWKLIHSNSHFFYVLIALGWFFRQCLFPSKNWHIRWVFYLYCYSCSNFYTIFYSTAIDVQLHPRPCQDEIPRKLLTKKMTCRIRWGLYSIFATQASLWIISTDARISQGLLPYCFLKKYTHISKKPHEIVCIF